MQQKDLTSRPSVYSWLYGLIPVSLYQRLSKMYFWLGLKPGYYEVPGFGPAVLEKGIVCLSADLELSWAWRFTNTTVTMIDVLWRQERENIPLIINILESLNISITWAIVGHLFLDRCSRNEGLAHSEMPRPPFFKNDFWDFGRGDWYDRDPCADFKSAPAWYAPGLIKLILGSRVKHEIACHSFSHVGFNEKYCSRELADAELRKCGEIMAKYGLRPMSMVFPGNEAGHFDLLAKHGYRAVRYFPRPGVEVSLPVRLQDHLWAIPESTNIVPDDDWSSDYVLWRLKKYVDAAARRKSLCHLWFHPSVNRERIDNVLVPILEYCAEKKKEGNIDMLTMAQIAELMDERSRMQGSRYRIKT